MQHNQFCPLCNNHLEDAQHLTNCPFNKEVIRLIWSWFNLAASTGPITESLDTASWLNSNAARASSPQARIYRNFIILLVQYLKRMQQAHLRLSSVAKEEIDMYEMFSCRGGGAALSGWHECSSYCSWFQGVFQVSRWLQASPGGGLWKLGR
jgi:hypothetical protein